MRCKDIMHNAHSFSLSLLDSHVKFLMPFIFQYLYFYTTLWYSTKLGQDVQLPVTIFLTFIQLFSQILGIFSQKLVLVANGWHLWLSTALIGIQEKCHRTTCVPSCLKLWNGQIFLKITTGSLSHFVLMDLSCENNHLCSILSQVIKWEIFLLKINNCSLFYLVSRYEVDNLFENDQLFFDLSWL